MRPKSLILLALALGCGLVASIGISQVLESRRNQKTAGAEQTDVLVALTDIERNAELSPKNVELKPWPKDRLPEGAITKIEDVIGRRPSTRIIKGEPILEGKLGTGETASRASMEIPAGYRAVPVRIENAQNTGLILPGDRVDVQVFVNKGTNVPEATTATFLKDVSVFAVNSEIRHDPATDAKIDAKTISLLVTPEQAAKLTLAESVGTIRLVLRGTHTEQATEDIQKVTLGSVLGGTQESGSHKDSHHVSVPPNDFKAFLDKQPPAAPAQTAPGKEPYRMVIVHGSDAHIEELHDGELLPRKLSLDGQPLEPAGGPVDVPQDIPLGPAPGDAPSDSSTTDKPQADPATGNQPAKPATSATLKIAD